MEVLGLLYRYAKLDIKNPLFARTEVFDDNVEHEMQEKYNLLAK